MDTNTEKKDNNLVNKTIGIIMIILNLLWIYPQLDRLYGFSGTLYGIIYPDWVLILNTICGLIGMFLAVRLIKRKISTWTAIPVNFGLICVCILIETLVSS